MFLIKDFLLAPDFRRYHAYTSEFSRVDGYEGISPITEHKYQDRDNLKSFFGFPIEYNTFYRITLPEYELPTYIHNDAAMARMTGILYLNRGITSKTAFWKHKESGLISAPTQIDLDRLGPDYMKKIVEDGLIESKWEQNGLVEAEYNDFLAFDSNLWHSCSPRGGFGKDVYDGRLIQVYFIQ